MSRIYKTERKGGYLQRGMYAVHAYEITIADDNKTVEKILLSSRDVTDIYLNKQKENEDYIRIRNVVSALLKDLNNVKTTAKYGRLLQLDAWSPDPKQKLCIRKQRYYGPNKLPTGTQSERNIVWVKADKLADTEAILAEYEKARSMMVKQLEEFSAYKSDVIRILTDLNSEGTDYTETDGGKKV